MLWIHPSSGKHDDVHISKYHQKLCWYNWSILPLVNILMLLVSFHWTLCHFHDLTHSVSYFDTRSFCYLWRSCWCPSSILLPETMLLLMMSVAFLYHVVWDLICYLKLCWYHWFLLPLANIFISLISAVPLAMFLPMIWLTRNSNSI